MSADWQSDAELAGTLNTVADISDIWDCISAHEDVQVDLEDLEYTYDVFMQFYREKGGKR